MTKELSLGKAVLELVTDGTGLEKGLTSAKSTAEGWSLNVSGAAKTAGLAIAGVGAAALAIGGTFLAMADSAAGTATQVRTLARETGLSAEEASKLRYAGERLNIDTDALSKSFGILSKSLESAHPSLAKYNIEVVKSKDGHIDMEATLGKVADRFKAMPDGVEKTALSMDIFGKSGKEMIPLLDRGSAGLAAMGEEATKMGLVFSQQGVDSAFAFGQAQKDLSERFEGLKNTIGIAVMPILTSLFSALADAAGTVVPLIAGAFTAVLPAIQGFIGVLRPIAEVWLGALGAELGALGGALGFVSNIFKALGEVIEVFTGTNKSAGGEMRNLIGGAAEPVMHAVALLRDTWLDLSAKIRVAIDAIVGYIAPFVEAAVGTLSRFWTEIQPKLAAAWESISEKIQFVVTTVIMPIVSFLVQFISDHFDQIAAVAGAVFGVIVGVIRTAWDVISGIFKIALDLISGNWQGAWDDMVGMLRAIWKDIGGIFNSLADFGANILKIAGDLGKNIVDGLWNGITGAWSGVMARIHDLVMQIPEGVRKLLGIESPSTVFMDIGEAIVQGLTLGINNTSAEAVAAVKLMLGEVSVVSKQITEAMTFNTKFGTAVVQPGTEGLGLVNSDQSIIGHAGAIPIFGPSQQTINLHIDGKQVASVVADRFNSQTILNGGFPG